MRQHLKRFERWLKRFEQWRLPRVRFRRSVWPLMTLRVELIGGVGGYRSPYFELFVWKVGVFAYLGHGEDCPCDDCIPF